MNEVQGCGTKLTNGQYSCMYDDVRVLQNRLRNGIAVSVRGVVNEARLLTYHKNERRVRGCEEWRTSYAGMYPNLLTWQSQRWLCNVMLCCATWKER